MNVVKKQVPVSIDDDNSVRADITLEQVKLLADLALTQSTRLTSLLTELAQLVDEDEDGPEGDQDGARQES